MRRLLVWILIGFLIFIFTGCKVEPFFGESDEITNLAFVKAVGIDKTDAGKTKVTVTSKLPKMSTQGEYTPSALVYTSEGDTVSSAIESMRVFADKKIFLGQSDYIVIGEDAARDDISKYLDFLSRFYECRLNTSVLIAKGSNAEEIIKSGSISAEYITTRIDNIFKASHRMSFVRKISLLDLTKTIDNNCIAAYVPTVQLTNKTGKEAVDKNEKDIKIDSYAVFKGSSLNEYLDSKTSRGINWATNYISKGEINICYQESVVSVSFRDTKTKTKATLENENIVIKYDINALADIVDMSNNTTVLNEEAIDKLQLEEIKIIKSEIQTAIDYAKENNADILGIAKIVCHKYPVEWQRIKGVWNIIFPKIKYEVIVRTKVERGYLITQSNKSKRSNIP